MNGHNSNIGHRFATLCDASLDPATFTHRDHVICAAYALQNYDFFEAAHLYASGLKALVTKAGVPEKFNATVTFAFLSVIAQKMVLHPDVPAEDLPDCCPELLQKDVLTVWYTKEILASDMARKIPVLPEIQLA
ncbi:hypothetical protein [Halocynthiibacter sp.]|uniref:hypothetical protein n=1 Tax=Halocynthiibacter sp. TaxID=1979210 RepID=UPI003C50897E